VRQERQGQGHWRVQLQQGGARASVELDVDCSRHPPDWAAPLPAAAWLYAVPQAEGNPRHTLLAEIYDAGKGIGKLIDDEVLVEIGKKHNKTGAQVALAWGIAQGHSVIPKSKTESRIKANLEGDFKLPQEDVDRISSIDKKLRFNDPSKSFGWNFYTDLDGKKN
jgi:hypothetical protein